MGPPLPARGTGKESRELVFRLDLRVPTVADLPPLFARLAELEAELVEPHVYSEWFVGHRDFRARLGAGIPLVDPPDHGWLVVEPVYLVTPARTRTKNTKRRRPLQLFRLECLCAAVGYVPETGGVSLELAAAAGDALPAFLDAMEALDH